MGAICLSSYRPSCSIPTQLHKECWPTKPLMIFVSALPSFQRRKSQGMTRGHCGDWRTKYIWMRHENTGGVYPRATIEEKRATHTKRGLVEGRPHRAMHNHFLTRPSDYQVRLCKKATGLTRPPTGRYFSPALPSDCFAIDFPGRAISPGEALPNFSNLS